MSLSKFTSANASDFDVAGRVNMGGRKIPFNVDIENDYRLTISNADGFRLSVCIAGGSPDLVEGSDDLLRPAMFNVECTLADGTVIRVEGPFDLAEGQLRFDAVDQTNFSWFWVEVFHDGDD